MKKVLLSILAFSIASSAMSITIKNGPYLTNVGENSATIVWTTDVPAVSWVEIAPDDNSHFYATERPKYFHSPLGKKQIETLHKVEIKNLKPATNYRYRIFSKEVVKTLPNGNVHYGNVASSVVYKKEPLKFRTADNSKKSFSFLMVNDIHEDFKRLEGMMKNVSGYDFLLMNGDMLSDMRSREQLFKGFMNTVSKETNGEIPVFMARGNHETRGPYSESYCDYFPNNNRGLPYYSFKWGCAYFIFLDGGEDKPDSDIEYTELADFDNYRTVQAKWLKSVLESDEFKKAPVKIVVTHIPPAWGGWHGALDVIIKYAKILNGKGIDIILSGHKHIYELIEGGTTAFEMPNLINSNMESALVTVTEDSIKISFATPDGKKARESLEFKTKSSQKK